MESSSALPGVEAVETDDGRRRDPILRQIVTDCGRLLGPHGFQLTQRGRILDAAVVGFRRPAEAACPATEQAAVVVGHNPVERILLAHLSGRLPQLPVTRRVSYATADQLAARSREIVKLVDGWVTSAAI
jgi:hypothetical protein